MKPVNTPPSEEWQSAFRTHATPETMQAAVRCARIEIGRLRVVMIEVPWDEEDLVQRVLVATCAGRVKWKPEVVPLRTHLRDKVRHACRRVRARHYAGEEPTVVALDAIDDDDALWGEVEVVLSKRTGEADPTLADLTRRFEAELWTRAAHDPIALRVLAVMSSGVTSISKIAKATALPVGFVVNAKKRLRRLGLRVSPPLLADIQAELHLDPSSDDAEPGWSADEREPPSE